MNYTEEIVWVDSELPIKIFVQENVNGIVPRHWHNSLEINYLLVGKMKSFVNGITNCFSDNDIGLINSGDVHSFDSVNEGKSAGITILIPEEFLRENYENIDNIIFDLDNEFAKERLKEIVKNIASTYTCKDNEFKSLKIKSYLYEMIYILFTYCKRDKKNNHSVNSNKYLDRIRNITSYIKENYKEDITLEEVARTYGLSKEHLSRNFKAYVGTTFTKYLESIRVYNAHRDLMNTDYSIIEIALENGFPNVKSFINSFKKTYGHTPNKYRKDNN